MKLILEARIELFLKVIQRTSLIRYLACNLGTFPFVFRNMYPIPSGFWLDSHHYPFMRFHAGPYRAACSVSILEEQYVWRTDAPTRIAYMDTQDIARLTLRALRNENINGKLLTLAGPRAWTAQEVLISDTVFSVPMAETYDLLGVDPKDIIALEKYLQGYFTNILKKLIDLKVQSKQTHIIF